MTFKHHQQTTWEDTEEQKDFTDFGVFYEPSPTRTNHLEIFRSLAFLHCGTLTIPFTHL